MTGAITDPGLFRALAAREAMRAGATSNEAAQIAVKVMTLHKLTVGAPTSFEKFLSALIDAETLGSLEASKHER